MKTYTFTGRGTVELPDGKRLTQGSTVTLADKDVTPRSRLGLLVAAGHLVAEAEKAKPRGDAS